MPSPKTCLLLFPLVLLEIFVFSYSMELTERFRSHPERRKFGKPLNTLETSTSLMPEVILPHLQVSKGERKATAEKKLYVV